MKSLAAQVKAFMEWKSIGGHPYGPTDLARDVAAYQGKLEAAKRCKRQDIENLLKKELARPRYLPELAKAMDTTAEVLASGRYIPGFSKVLKLNELNDHEGQLVLMFRALPPEVQDHVLEEMNKLYVKAHPASSPANPWANAPAPGAAKTGAKSWERFMDVPDHPAPSPQRKVK